MWKKTKAKIVNQIKEYTDDIEVLKSIIKSDNIPALIDKVVSVYKTLRKPQYKIRQEYADAINRNYKDTDDIQGYSMLTLDKKVFE